MRCLIDTAGPFHLILKGISMAQTSTRSRSHTSTHARAARSTTTDAIALLKADHREVEDLFEQFEKSRSEDKKVKLAQQICQALKLHTQIEEEIFYPAFLEGTGNKDIHHEAQIEHDGAKKLIAQIESSQPSDDYFDARVRVLSEMIKHHVREEEKRDGMFAEARDSDMDLDALGEQLQRRKEELSGGAMSATDGLDDAETEITFNG